MVLFFNILIKSFNQQISIGKKNTVWFSLQDHVVPFEKTLLLLLCIVAINKMELRNTSSRDPAHSLPPIIDLNAPPPWIRIHQIKDRIRNHDPASYSQ